MDLAPSPRNSRRPLEPTTGNSNNGLIYSNTTSNNGAPSSPKRSGSGSRLIHNAAANPLSAAATTRNRSGSANVGSGGGRAHSPRSAAASKVGTVEDTPYDRYTRDQAILTEQNAIGNDIKERLWERKKYSFASREDLALRVASTMTTGRYELPKFLSQSGASFLDRVGASTQTATVTTRNVGLGDGDIDALAPERNIDIPLNMPEVGEFPILSLPQQLEAERRIVSLLARIEAEIHRCAEEVRREAAKDAKKAELSKYKQSLYCDTAEWENRMLSAVTTRMRDKHKGVEENFGRDHDLNAYLRQHRIETEGRDRLMASGGSPVRGGIGFGSSDGGGAIAGVIPQPLTPAVQHILKVKPILKGNVEEMKALAAAAKANENGGARFGSPTSMSGAHSSSAFSSPSAAGSLRGGGPPMVGANGKPLSRGMRIALSANTFVTPRETYHQHQHAGNNNGNGQQQPPPLGGAFGRPSPSLDSAAGGGGARQLPNRRGRANPYRQQSGDDPLAATYTSGSMGGSGPFGGMGGAPSLSNPYSDPMMGMGMGMAGSAHGSMDYANPYSNTVSLSQPTARESRANNAHSMYGDGDDDEYSPAPDRGGGMMDGYSTMVGPSSDGVSYGDEVDLYPHAHSGRYGAGKGSLGGASSNTLNAPSMSTAASTTVSPSPAYSSANPNGAAAAADLINAGIGSPKNAFRYGQRATGAAPPQQNGGGSDAPPAAGGGAGFGSSISAHPTTFADAGGGGAAAVRTDSGASVNAALGNLVNDEHSPRTRANRRAAGNAMIAGIGDIDEVRSRLK